MSGPRLTRMLWSRANSRRTSPPHTSTGPTACSIVVDVVGKGGGTTQRVVAPTALLVALGEHVAAHCTAVLGGLGLRVLRVSHAAAARERIPVVMPQLVVVSHDLAAEEIDALTDGFVAVGAELLRLDPAASTDALTAALTPAGIVAKMRAAER
jgi:hypothetical protein